MSPLDRFPIMSTFMIQYNPRGWTLRATPRLLEGEGLGQDGPHYPAQSLSNMGYVGIDPHNYPANSH